MIVRGGRQAELVEDGGDVFLDRALGDDQPFRDVDSGGVCVFPFMPAVV
jgi:hypothetical protein